MIFNHDVVSVTENKNLHVSDANYHVVKWAFAQEIRLTMTLTMNDNKNNYIVMNYIV